MWITAATVLLLLLSALAGVCRANLRCYSCYPCNELEFFSGDVRHWEADCYIDRYCLKITGATRDIFGYRQEVSFRGCPWVSLLGTFEEGCTQSSINIAGAGLVEGTVCLCSTHLCNVAVPAMAASSFAAATAAIATIFYLNLYNNWSLR